MEGWQPMTEARSKEDKSTLNTEGPTGSAQIVAAQVPGITGLLGLAVGVVIVAALYFGQAVLVPITLAILLSFVLSPLVELLRMIRMPKVPSVLLSVLAALGVLIAIFGFSGAQIAVLAGDAPAYARTIDQKVDRVSAFVSERLAFLDQSDRSPSTAPSENFGVPQLSEEMYEPVWVRVIEDSTPLNLALEWLSPVLGPLQTFAIVLVVAIFILLQKEDLRDRLIRLFGSSDLHRTTTAMDDAGARLSRYFLTQLAVNSAYGVIVTAGLWFIGLPVPALWGILAAILRFVPYVGSLLGSALPLVVAAGVDPGWSMVIWVVVLFAVLDPLLGYGVEPHLYGQSTGLSPLAVVLAAIFWTWIWGPIGLVLSMPLTLCLVVLGRHIRSLEFLDVLLGDRPALTPVESFYQRMLANDPDEALEHAELLLEDRTLEAYYDDVALGGLKLAAEDARRGVVDRDAAKRIVAGMLSMIDELGELDDASERETSSTPFSPVEGSSTTGDENAPVDRVSDAPAGWQDAGTVTCIAGRGVLDDAVTAIMAQLLSKRNFGVRRVEHAAVSREAIERLDMSSARIFCVSYLEIGGTPAHLRYLVRRLRRKVPAARIIVGMWPAGEEVLSNSDIQQSMGADRYVGTLHEAVSACCEIAGSHETDLMLLEG